MCERIWKGELKQFWALRKKEAKCVGIWEIKRMGKYLKLGIGEVKKIVGIEEIIEKQLQDTIWVDNKCCRSWFVLTSLKTQRINMIISYKFHMFEQ